MLFLQKENLDLAFKTGERVGITATLVRRFALYISRVYNLKILNFNSQSYLMIGWQPF